MRRKCTTKKYIMFEPFVQETSVLPLPPLSTEHLSALSWDFQPCLNTQLVELMSSCNSSFLRVCDVSFGSCSSVEGPVLFSPVCYGQVRMAVSKPLVQQPDRRRSKLKPSTVAAPSDGAEGTEHGKALTSNTELNNG